MYPLDASAIVHLAVNSRKTTNSFRLSMTLAEPVREAEMQQALAAVCPRFPTIAASIQNGFLRHHVVPAREALQLEKEERLLPGFTPEQIQKCAMRVLYRDNRISVEMFHSLTDGYGGYAFLKALVGEYLRRCGKVRREELEGLRMPDTQIPPQELEDSFQTYAGTETASLPHIPSYQLFPQDEGKPVRQSTVSLPVAPLLEQARSCGGTITSLLTAVLGASVMELQKNHETKLLPVQVMVPIDLRKRFPSISVRNFSLYALPQLLPGEEDLPVKALTEKIRVQLEAQFAPERLRAMITTSVLPQRNFLLSRVPRAVKCLGIKLGYYFFGSGNSSISLSNLGQLEMPQAMQPHVKRVDCLLTPRIGGAYNCGLISYGGMVRINFTRRCEQAELERIFIRRLEALGLTPEVEMDGQSGSGHML